MSSARDPPSDVAGTNRRRKATPPDDEALADLRLRGLRADRASFEEFAPGRHAGPGEPDTFLVEVDRLREELAGRVLREGVRSERDEKLGRTTTEEASEGFPVEVGKWGRPSPYLEERVTRARSTVAQLSHESRILSQGMGSLRHDLEGVEDELARISEELDFHRSRTEAETAPWDEGNEPGPPPAYRVTDKSRLAAGPSRADPREARGTAAPEPTGSFSDFTLSRYNQTVRDLHERQSLLGWGTVAAAAAISAVLLYLTLRANEPAPPVWLAFLPLVWMVPVPFFVAAFRGTQRVLSRNRLDLPEQP